MIHWSFIVQAAGAIPTPAEDETRFRSLTFEDEEDRVRDGTDTYLPGGGGLGVELRRVRAERDRSA